MSGLFYNLGKKLGPKVRKAKWLWQSIAGTEDDAIRVEHEVGRDLSREIKRHLQLDPEPHAARMVQKTGADLAARVADKRRTFTFEIVKGTEPNAFALPGGFIFVTRSLLELCEQNLDELAFILAHEMGHVIKGHAMDRFISNSAIALGSRAAPVRGLIARWLRTVGVKFLESTYSQDLELEADTLGARLTAAAGYDRQAPAKLLSRLARLGRHANQSALGSYFSSHPAFDLRIERVNRLLKPRSG
jgi:predicted Zn-dependent protease